MLRARGKTCGTDSFNKVSQSACALNTRKKVTNTQGPRVGVSKSHANIVLLTKMLKDKEKDQLDFHEMACDLRKEEMVYKIILHTTRQTPPSEQAHLVSYSREYLIKLGGEAGNLRAR